MGKRKPSRTREQIIKDTQLVRPLIAYVQRYHPETKIHFLSPTKSEMVADYNFALMGLNAAGIIIQDPNAPKKLRNHAEKVIRRARDAVCFNPGGAPRKGISLYALDYGIIKKIKEAYQQHREGVDRKKYMSELISYIKEAVQGIFGGPLSPGWEERIRKIPWKNRKEVTVVLSTLCVLTGRERNSVGREKREYDKDMAKAERELAQYIESLRQKNQ